MTVFLTTLFLLGIALTVHVLIWKLRLPRRQMRALALAFAGVYVSWLIATSFMGIPLFMLLHITLFYTACSLCYIITYSAIEADSPTLSLMRFIDRQGPGGVSSETAEKFLAQHLFVNARLAALIDSGMIVFRNDRYIVAGQPSLFFRLILDFRKLYGPISRGG